MQQRYKGKSTNMLYTPQIHVTYLVLHKKAELIILSWKLYRYLITHHYYRQIYPKSAALNRKRCNKLSMHMCFFHSYVS